MKNFFFNIMITVHKFNQILYTLSAVIFTYLVITAISKTSEKDFNSFRAKAPIDLFQEKEATASKNVDIATETNVSNRIDHHVQFGQEYQNEEYTTTSMEKITTMKLLTISSVHINEAIRISDVLYYPKDGHCEGLNYLVVIHCRFSDYHRRQLWRRLYKDLSEQYNFALIFPLGTADSVSSPSYNQTQLEEEMDIHGDILQSDFFDSYKNLTYKHVSSLKYFYEKCDTVPILLKMDEENVWNVKLTSEYIANLKQGSGISCRWLHNRSPYRSGRWKWIVSKSEYPHAKYPSYCMGGPGVITTREDVGKILEAMPSVPFIWIDDLFVTGLVRAAANVSCINTPLFNNYGELVKGKALTAMSNQKETETLFNKVNFQNTSLVIKS